MMSQIMNGMATKQTCNDAYRDINLCLSNHKTANGCLTSVIQVVTHEMSGSKEDCRSPRLTCLVSFLSLFPFFLGVESTVLNYSVFFAYLVTQKILEAKKDDRKHQCFTHFLCFVFLLLFFWGRIYSIKLFRVLYFTTIYHNFPLIKTYIYVENQRLRD